MPLYSAFGDAEPVADLFIAHAFHDELQNLEFARAQVRARWAIGEAFAHRAGQVAGAGMHAPDGIEQFTVRHPLQQVALRAGGEGAVDILIALIGGEHDKAGGGVDFANVADRIEPALFRHAQIDQGHIGLVLDVKLRVFILGNHGIVICGDSPLEAEALLREVEFRVAIQPRPIAEPNWDDLAAIADRTGWKVPSNPAVHSLGLDPVSRNIVTSGILYPCQAIFLAASTPVVSRFVSAADAAETESACLIIEGAGTLLRPRQNPVESLTLAGLAQVVLRLPETAPIAYLSQSEVGDLLCADVYHYRARVEGNSSDQLPFRTPPAREPGVELR